MSLADVTRDEVKKQLRIMGYDNISDDLIEEFLQELKVSEDTTSMSNFQTSTMDSSKLIESETEVSESKTMNPNSINSTSYNTTHLNESDEEEDLSIATTAFVSKGKHYEPPTLKSNKPFHPLDTTEPESSDSDTETDDQVISIKSEERHIRRDMRQPLHETTGNHMNRTRPRSSANPQYIGTSSTTFGGKGVNPTTRAKYPYSRGTSHNRPQSSHGVRPPSSHGARPSSAVGSRPVSASRRSSISGPMVPRPRGENYRKKVNDPVRRFQEMQRTWGNDRFLNSRKSNHKNLRMQVRREMREISAEAEAFGYMHVF